MFQKFPIRNFVWQPPLCLWWTVSHVCFKQSEPSIRSCLHSLSESAKTFFTKNRYGLLYSSQQYSWSDTRSYCQQVFTFWTLRNGQFYQPFRSKSRGCSFRPRLLLFQRRGSYFHVTITNWNSSLAIWNQQKIKADCSDPVFGYPCNLPFIYFRFY